MKHLNTVRLLIILAGEVIATIVLGIYSNSMAYVVDNVAYPVHGVINCPLNGCNLVYIHPRLHKLFYVPVAITLLTAIYIVVRLLFRHKAK